MLSVKNKERMQQSVGYALSESNSSVISFISWRVIFSLVQLFLHDGTVTSEKRGCNGLL